VSSKESKRRDYERHRDAYIARASARYQRLKNDANFKQKKAEQLRNWAAKNREHVNESANRRQKKLRKRDSSKFRAADKRKYAKIKADPIRYAALLKYYRERPARRLYSLRHIARKKGAKGSHTLTQWLARVEYYGWCCVYCGKHLTVKTLTKDHFKPLAKGGADFASNLVPACLSCNCRKGGR
jgi:5-methylcytosine-specific restriction endonuclease McrA